jgi:hypothetical protein
MRNRLLGLLVLVVSACVSSTLVDPARPTVTVQNTFVLPPSETPSPFPIVEAIPTKTPSLTPSPSGTPYPTLFVPTSTSYPDAPHFSIGQSWEGRDIWAWQFGGGPTTIVLIGGIHGGAEANTTRLADLLVSHFHQNPDQVLPGIHLFIIPTANPDGLSRGGSLAGRLNAHQVDLNRNWGCEWADTAYLRKTPVSPGPRPFSEVETLALRSFFLTVSPDAALLYHSAAGGIFMGQCGDSAPGADWLGPLLDAATGYRMRKFTAYEVSGDASNWLAERGIPSAVVELSSDDKPEFDRNLAGVMALQCHFAQESITDPQLVPTTQQLCEP